MGGKKNGVKRVIILRLLQSTASRPRSLREDMPPRPMSPYASKNGGRRILQAIFQGVWPRNGPTPLFQCLRPAHDPERRLRDRPANFFRQLGTRGTNHHFRRWRANRDFTHVDDVVAANLLAMAEAPHAGAKHRTSPPVKITQLIR